jgi:hypothetical protein
MPNLKVSREGRPILDIFSDARRGPGRRDHLSAAEIAQISRTVRRVPEVVMKVVAKGSHSLSSVSEHIRYIGRHGALELESDDGDRLRGKAMAQQLLEDWDLDLDDHRRQSTLSATKRQKPLKLVHKLMFSMPAGTPAGAVREAASRFLREEFAHKHRYAFVLHTDERHPHVHAVVKALSEQGIRLDIRKATLRRWREKFARHLRAQGIEANATGRAVRGESQVRKSDAIYRAARRGASTHMRERAVAVARELQSGSLTIESGKATLVRTRGEVVRGWRATQDLLMKAGELELADRVDRFVQQMRPPQTEKESIAEALVQHVTQQPERLPRAKRLAPVK